MSTLATDSDELKGHLGQIIAEDEWITVKRIREEAQNMKNT